MNECVEIIERRQSEFKFLLFIASPITGNILFMSLNKYVNLNIL